MSAVVSPGMSSPATSPPSATSSPSAQTGMSSLVSSPVTRRTTLNRPPSYSSRNRLSQYSSTSANGACTAANGMASSQSRPVSDLFTLHASSLTYTLIRDFAYPTSNPMHYGPPPETSVPPSARLSGPAPLGEEKMPWESWGNGGSDWDEGGRHIVQFADGPPWSEDEDLASPVVSSRRRKNKAGISRRRDDDGALVNFGNLDDQEKGVCYTGTNVEGDKRDCMTDGGESNGPGGEYVTFPTDRDNSHGANGQPRRFADEEYRSDSGASSPSSPRRKDNQSRYSRDYQFTITSPDEEMHGKAVALFDFKRENENELPLVEGQVIWVSYRHGQGWLVAKDPKTQENGLVPEAYVRLLRDIEGGINSLAGICNDSPAVSPHDSSTPVLSEQAATTTPPLVGIQTPAPATVTPAAAAASAAAATPPNGHVQNQSVTSANGYHQPVVSTFSTSSKDLDLYPTDHLGIHAGQAPPQVVHYRGQRGGSQASTPVLVSHGEADLLPREALENGHEGRKKSDPSITTLPIRQKGPSDIKADAER